MKITKHHQKPTTIIEITSQTCLCSCSTKMFVFDKHGLGVRRYDLKYVQYISKICQNSVKMCGPQHAQICKNMKNEKYEKNEKV